MQNKKNKVLLSIIFLMIILVGAIVCFKLINKDDNSENITKVYTRNDYGLFRDENEISEEAFDEFGNLIRYKYKHKGDNGDFIEEEYNIDYEFDEENKLIKYSDNKGNQIDIRYDNNNRISGITNISEENKEKIQYEFQYLEEEIVVEKKQVSTTELIANNEATGEIEEQNLTVESTESVIAHIKNIEINEVEYYMYTENMQDIDKFYSKEYLITKKDQSINYSNLVSLLNYCYAGYINPEENKCENVLGFWYGNPEENIFNYGSIEYPIFDADKIISMKYETTDSYSGEKKGIYDNYYYDKKGRLLLHKSTDTENGETYLMYEDINENEYKCTYITKFEDKDNWSQCVSGTFKVNLDNNGKILKKEIVEEKEISEEAYENKLPEYESYFTYNNVTKISEI